MTVLRIAMVLHGWPSHRAGGTGMVVESLAVALKQLGHQVCVMAPLSSIEPVYGDPSGIEVIPLPVPPPQSWDETWIHPALDQQFRRTLQSWKPDVVHFHHFSGLSFGMVEQARSLGARVVLCLHDYAIPCARGQLVTHEGRLCSTPVPSQCARCLAQMSPLGPGKGRLLRALARVPGVSRSTRAWMSQSPRVSSGLEKQAQQRIDHARALLRSVDRLEAPSTDLCDRIERMGMPRPTLVPLPLVHEIQPAPSVGDGPVRFLFIGSLIPTKGPARLLQAFARLEPGSATLTILGEPVPFFGRVDYITQLRKEAAKTPGVQLCDPVTSEGISPVLSRHDVLVLPSRWPENSPLVIREATAAGLRTIVSSIGGASELDPRTRKVGVEDTNELFRALLLEVEIGRARNPIRHWPSPTEVAQWHIGNSYGVSTSDADGTLSS